MLTDRKIAGIWVWVDAARGVLKSDIGTMTNAHIDNYIHINYPERFQTGRYIEVPLCN
jgi:hypothetical protein